MLAQFCPYCSRKHGSIMCNQKKKKKSIHAEHFTKLKWAESCHMHWVSNGAVPSPPVAVVPHCSQKKVNISSKQTRSKLKLDRMYIIGGKLESEEKLWVSFWDCENTLLPVLPKIAWLYIETDGTAKATVTRLLLGNPGKQPRQSKTHHTMWTIWFRVACMTITNGQTSL